MDICTICRDPLENNIVTTKHCKCKVSYHRECLDTCMKNHIFCPICRIKPKHEFHHHEIDDFTTFFNILHSGLVTMYIDIKNFIKEVKQRIHESSPIYLLFVMVLICVFPEAILLIIIMNIIFLIAIIIWVVLIITICLIGLLIKKFYLLLFNRN